MDLLYPLSEFYEESGLTLPAFARAEPGEVPEPYRSLLVHDRDMTPTLEAAYGGSIHLRVMKSARRDNVISRQVVLVLDHDETPVEIGAIKIYLEHFAEEAKRLVLEGHKPLGSILHSQGMAHNSRPEAYFRVTPDAMIGDALRVNGTGPLFGRQNILWGPEGHALASVVEILSGTDTNRG